MGEYRIKITGKYDVIVISPKITATLIDKIRRSNKKEMVIPAEEILSQEYAQYLTCVLEANAEIAKALPNRNAYTLIAEQLKKLQCNERDCFDHVEVREPDRNPRFGMGVSEYFYIMAKRENNQFRYIFKGENDEEISNTWIIG